MPHLIIDRQESIANGTETPLALPKFSCYTITSLRGGIGKTSLSFNLSYLVDNLLVIDTCAQGNLSYFFDNKYQDNPSISSYEMLLPYFIPGLGKSTGVAQKISATNSFFVNRNEETGEYTEKNNYFIKSSNQLYMLPSQITTALAQAKTTFGSNQATLIDNMLYSLKQEMQREMNEINADKCLIDTSPFFAGATHLAWHATNALIIPVRTDEQSINALKLLLDTLQSSQSEFRRTMPSDNHTPKIQCIVLTHCGWSTAAGSRNKPNQQTKMFLTRIFELIKQKIQLFTTDDPNNHLLMLDDFLGSGRMSTAKSKPILCMNAGDTMYVDKVKTSVNESVEKIKNELKFIKNSIW